MNFIEKLRHPQNRVPLIGGHRGHLSDIRENTIENFEQIRHLGLSHIEVDVQLSADDVLVIYHDIDLVQRSPLSGRVRDYTVAELRAAFSINTLDEVLAWCIHAGMAAALEIKCCLLEMSNTMPVLAEKIAQALEAHDFYDHGFVFSTDYCTLSRIKKLAPRTNLGLIVPFVPVDPIRLMQEMDAIIYLCYADNLSKELVETLHQNGYYVDGSVINDAKQLQTAISLGVDLIESDYPEQIIKLS